MTSSEEAAAIAAALQYLQIDEGARPAPVSAWTLAMRQPDLCIDDVRDIVRRRTSGT